MSQTRQMGQKSQTFGKDKKGYHKLLVWQRSHELVLLVYKYTALFPQSEEFGLRSQLRRAAVSVALTIVEGYRRRTVKDYTHFLNIAEGSLTELEAGFEICMDLQYLTNDQYLQLETKRGEVGYLLTRLLQSLH